jgi:hypothetical protein
MRTESLTSLARVEATSSMLAFPVVDPDRQNRAGSFRAVVMSRLS